MVDELKRITFSILADLLENMLGRADDVLFKMGERAQSDGERRRYFDTMRVLRLERDRIIRQFNDALAGSFNRIQPIIEHSVESFDIEELTMQPTEDLEETIAVSNLITRAEGEHKQLIWEVERRLDFASRDMGQPVSARALSPTRICEAFRDSMAGIECEFEIKLIVYKLFEREVIPQLHLVYESAMDLFDRHGIAVGFSNAAREDHDDPEIRAADEVRREQESAARIQEQVANAEALHGGRAPHRAPGSALDTRLLDLLQKRAASASSRADSDGRLANELAGVLQRSLSGRGPAKDSEASLQRLSLANQYFDALLAEPLLPEGARPLLDSLRFSVVKTALADTSFFNTAAHPLRRLLTEMVDLAVSSSIGEGAPQRRLGEFVREVAARADVDGDVVRTAVQHLKPLEGPQLKQFLDQMQNHERERRDVMLSKVRRLVAQELQVQTVGREVPAPAQAVLRSGIGPLMAVRLLRHGRGSPPYKEAHVLLERVLDSLDIAPAANDDARHNEREALIKAITEALTGIGMKPERIEVLVASLREAYDSVDKASAEAARLAAEKTKQAEAATAAIQPAPAPASNVANIADSRPSLWHREPQPAPRMDMGLPTATVLDLLSRILTPEAWFRVFDPNTQSTRWLKLSSFYSHREHVLFSGFDEGVKLSIDAHQLAEDFASGRSEPVNPDASAKDALERLRSARAARYV